MPSGQPSPPREPRTSRRTRRASVAGVAGGVGTTTVATAIGATDWGVFTGHRVDVLVCRATGDSLVRAGRAAHELSDAGHPRPVIAVTAGDATGPSRPVTARLRLLEPHAETVVVLPFVRRWRDLSAPLDEARDLLTRSPAETPRPLRRYAAAARAVQAALGGRAERHSTIRPALTVVPTRTQPTSTR